MVAGTASLYGSCHAAAETCTTRHLSAPPSSSLGFLVARPSLLPSHRSEGVPTMRLRRWAIPLASVRAATLALVQPPHEFDARQGMLQTTRARQLDFRQVFQALLQLGHALGGLVKGGQ